MQILARKGKQKEFKVQCEETNYLLILHPFSPDLPTIKSQPNLKLPINK